MISPAPCGRDGVIAAGSPHNPFARGSREADALDYAFVAPLTAAASFDRLCELGGQAQILGVEGSGKTTLLSTLTRYLRARGGEAIAVRCDRCSDVEGELRSTFGQPCALVPRLACLDEADALRPALRRRLRRVAEELQISLLFASHRDLRLPTLLRCEVDEALAVRVTSEVLRRSPETPALVAAHEIGEALRQRGGNLRDALGLMYDWYEERWALQRGRQSWAR